MVFFYLAGDKKSLFEPKLIYGKKKKTTTTVGQVKHKYLVHNRTGFWI